MTTTTTTWVNGLTLVPDDHPSGYSFKAFNAQGTVKQTSGSNWFHLPIPYTVRNGERIKDVTLIYKLEGVTIDRVDLRGDTMATMRSGTRFPPPFPNRRETPGLAPYRNTRPSKPAPSIWSFTSTSGLEAALSQSMAQQLPLHLQSRAWGDPVRPARVTGVYVAAIYDQSTGTRSIYVDGVQVAERTDNPITVMSSIADVGFGVLLNPPTTFVLPFQGLIDEIEMFDRALTRQDTASISFEYILQASQINNYVISGYEISTLRELH